MVTTLTNGRMRLDYVSSWPSAFLHCRMDDEAAWTEPPGLPMQSTGNCRWSIIVDVTQLEFVCTNGSGAWDKPAHGGNYRISGAGWYELQSGCITVAPVSEEPTIDEQSIVPSSSVDETLTSCQSSATLFRSTSRSKLGSAEGLVVHEALDEAIRRRGCGLTLTILDAVSRSLAVRFEETDHGFFLEAFYEHGENSPPSTAPSLSCLALSPGALSCHASPRDPNRELVGIKTLPVAKLLCATPAPPGTTAMSTTTKVATEFFYGADDLADASVQTDEMTYELSGDSNK